MWEWISLLPYLVVALLVALFGVLMLSVSLLEKQYVRQFVPAAAGNPGATSRYFEAMNQAAGAQGYVSCGTYAQNRAGAAYKAFMALWLGPDGATMACILGGKIARIDYKKTLLISWMDADKILVTTDDFGGSDLSGTRRTEVVFNGDFDELHTRHAQRLAASTLKPRVLGRDSALAHYEQMEELRAQRLLSLGLVRSADASGNVWRYTLKGAWRNFVDGLQQMKNAKSQAERIKKKRPGS